jgi:transcriptional regulator with XRE-family HTH domain
MDKEGTMDFTLMGKRLKKHRLAKNLKQTELAEKTNLSVDYISKMERGQRIPAIPVFVELLNVLEVSADDILSGTVKQGYVRRTAEYVERIGKLPKNDQERIFDILDAYLEKR